jgi:hypothetical protein
MGLACPNQVDRFVRVKNLYSTQYVNSVMARVTASNMTATRATVILRPLLFEAFGFWGLFQALFKSSASFAKEIILVAAMVALMVAYAAIYVSVKMLYDE